MPPSQTTQPPSQFAAAASGKSGVDDNKEGASELGDGVPNLPSNTAKEPHLLEQTVGGTLEVPPLQTIHPPSQFTAAASGKSAVNENK